MFICSVARLIFIARFSGAFTEPLKVLVQTVVFYFTLNVFKENVSSVCECVFVNVVNQ